MKNYIFYQGVTQFENTGDLIINKSLIELLRPYGHLVFNDRGVPQWYLEELGIKDHERLRSFSGKGFAVSLLFAALRTSITRRTTVYLFSGPGHFYGFSTMLAFRNFMIGCFFLVLRILSCKIVKIGTSLGPISDLLLKTEYFKSISMNGYFVRDSLSIQLAKERGRIKKVTFFPDLAWSLQVDNTAKSLWERREVVMFSFRDSTHGLALEPKYKAKIIEKVKAVMDCLRPLQDYQFILSYQVDADLELCKILYEHFKDTYNIKLLEQKITTFNAPEIYSRTKYIFSNRLHVLLFGSKFGSLPIPMVDVKKHLKISGIFSDANLAGLVIDLYQNDVVEKMNLILKYEDDYRSKLLAVEQAYSDESKELISRIFTNKKSIVF